MKRALFLKKTNGLKISTFSSQILQETKITINSTNRKATVSNYIPENHRQIRGAKYLLLFLTLFLIVFSFENTAFGQVGFKTNESLSVEMIPEFPEPETRVSLIIESFSFDLNSSDIKWFVRGKEVASGKGIKKINFINGKLGEQTNIGIRITTIDGDIIEKTFTIHSSTVDLVYEADTYTPPFFKGKPLFSIQSVVKFIAIPHMFVSGKELNPDTLIYKWYKDGDVIDDLSGYGKSSANILTSVLGRTVEMEVEVTDPVSGNTSYGFLNINPITPFILFYEKTPLYGTLFNNVLGNEISLQKKEVTFTVVPYFFSTRNANQKLIYDWYINGDKLTDGLNTNERLFRVEDDKEGKANVSLYVSYPEKIMQTFNTSMNVIFKKQLNISNSI